MMSMSILQCDIFWWKLINCEIKKLLITNNKKLLNSYNWHSGCPNYKKTAFVCFIFKSAGVGEGWFEGDSTWLIHYQKKTPKNTDSHPAVLLNSFKLCAPVVFVWFWLFFSCLRRRGRQYKRESDITIVFPNIAFYFFTTIKCPLFDFKSIFIIFQ
jgi:hypothetical protein